MGRVLHRLRRRAIVVLAALLLALAVAPVSASASLSVPAQRAVSSLVYVSTAPVAAEAATARSVRPGQGARAALDSAVAAPAGSPVSPLRCCAAALPETYDGRYTYLDHCALLC